MEELFTIGQAAAILKVHPVTVRAWVKRGKIATVYVGAKPRIRASELAKFVNRCTEEAAG